MHALTNLRYKSAMLWGSDNKGGEHTFRNIFSFFGRIYFKKIEERNPDSKEEIINQGDWKFSTLLMIILKNEGESFFFCK